MRTLALVCIGLTLVPSTQASPVWRNTAGIEFGAASLIELMRDGCGRGWHQSRWRDQWGNWQWGHCIPNRGPHDAWRQVGTIPAQIGEGRLGAGVIRSQANSKPG